MLDELVKKEYRKGPILEESYEVYSIRHNDNKYTLTIHHKDEDSYFWTNYKLVDDEGVDVTTSDLIDEILDLCSNIEFVDEIIQHRNENKSYG
jgi:hypothetical protein